MIEPRNSAIRAAQVAAELVRDPIVRIVVSHAFGRMATERFAGEPVRRERADAAVGGDAAMRGEPSIELALIER